MFDSDSNSSQKCSDSRIDFDSGIGIMHHCCECLCTLRGKSLYMYNSGECAMMSGYAFHHQGMALMIIVQSTIKVLALLLVYSNLLAPLRNWPTCQCPYHY